MILKNKRECKWRKREWENQLPKLIVILGLSDRTLVKHLKKGHEGDTKLGTADLLPLVCVCVGRGKKDIL